MSKGYKNCTIDLAKLVGSIMIFTMHISAFSDMGGGTQFIFELLSRWGVPFFFITSSYFLFSEKNLKLEKHSVSGTRKWE